MDGWSRFLDAFFKPELIERYFPAIMKGVVVTIEIACDDGEWDWERAARETEEAMHAGREIVYDLTDGRGVDVAITAAAAGVTQEQALQYAARQGRISFFGGLPKDNSVIACDSNHPTTRSSVMESGHHAVINATNSVLALAL